MTTLLALALVAGSGQTVERAGVVARAAVDPESVALVDTVALTLTVEAESPLTVEPVKYVAPPGWTLVETGSAVVEALPANRARWRASFRLSPDRPGELPLPPPGLRVRAAGRQSVTEIDWKPFEVRVSTSLADATLDEAKGISGPIRLPDEPASSAGWLVAAGVAAVVLTVVLARRRRPTVPDIAPEDEACSRLAALAPFDVDGLDAILRRYLVRRRNVAADRLTTDELAATLDADWLAHLRRCDLARYAGRPFDAAEWEDAITRAQSLIPASLPVGEAAPVAGAGENASSRGDAAADTLGE